MWNPVGPQFSYCDHCASDGVHAYEKMPGSALRPTQAQPAGI